MRTITFIITLFTFTFTFTLKASCPQDTTFSYNNRKVQITDKGNELNISVFNTVQNGDSVAFDKIYEAVFSDSKSIERRYENRFEIFVPDIFKPKEKRYSNNAHWGGFGMAFINLPDGSDFQGELASIINRGKSLQYNINIGDASYRIGKSNFKVVSGFGIQFNSVHFQTNKAIEVKDYTTVVTTTPEDSKYHKSRLHYTYLKMPLLLETGISLNSSTSMFLNAGIIGKIKTASSSKVWNMENGKKVKHQMEGDLNIRPFTCDLIVQAGIDDIGIFATYSPYSLFIDRKGPSANQFTVGMQFYF